MVGVSTSSASTAAAPQLQPPVTPIVDGEKTPPMRAAVIRAVAHRASDRFGGDEPPLGTSLLDERLDDDSVG